MRTTCIFLLLFTSFATKAQDIIYPKKREPIEAKVEQVKPNIIIYKRADNIDGPLYELEKRYIDSIVYENGTVEHFKMRMGPPRPGPRERMHEEPGVPRHQRIKDPRYINHYTQQFSAGVVLLNPDVVILSGWEDDFNMPQATVAATIKYQKDFFKNWLGLSVSPYIGMNRKTFGGSLSLRGNLKHTGRVRLSVGPEYTFTRLDLVSVYYVSGTYESIARKYTTNLSTLYGTVELNFHFNPQWYLDLNCGLGGYISNSNLNKNIPGNWTREKSGEPSVRMGLGIGYRF